MKKRILFIITHLELGGAQKQLLSILKSINQAKYIIHLITSDKGYLKEEFLRLSYIKLKLIPQLKRRINPLLDTIVFFKIYFYIKRNRFYIVHTHSPKASILGRWAAYFAGTKNIIYTVHGWPFHKFMNSFSYYLYLFLEKLTAKITKKIIVVSKADFRIGIEKKIASPDKLILIHYGVDIGLWESIFLKRKEWLPSGNLIVNVSSLKLQKDLYSFLEMAKLILNKKRQLRFFIIGEGPLKKQIMKAIKKCGLENHVFLKGWAKDIFSLLSKASLLVLTSLWEGLPLVVIEAVIAGVPMVVTDTGGVLDIVENHHNGIITQPKQIQKLSEAVIMILDNYNEWRKKIENHRKNLNLLHWSQERMIEETESIYEAL
jgi:glycosyltransferase involved in cell wall biosynthesis